METQNVYVLNATAKQVIDPQQKLKPFVIRKSES